VTHDTSGRITSQPTSAAWGQVPGRPVFRELGPADVAELVVGVIAVALYASERGGELHCGTSCNPHAPN
jgi:hypothetical protein